MAATATSTLFSIAINPNHVLKPKRFILQPNLPFFKSLKCIHSKPNTSLSCSTVAFPETAELVVASKLRHLADEFQSFPEPMDRMKRLLHYAGLITPMDESVRVDANRVM